jgi:hypothetical protein
MVKADGKPDRIVAKVTVGSRPDHGAIVLVRGAGVRQTKRTSANGVVVMRINPKKAGLITVSTPDTRRSCGPRLVAVVAPLLPPVAG